MVGQGWYLVWLKRVLGSTFCRSLQWRLLPFDVIQDLLDYVWNRVVILHLLLFRAKTYSEKRHLPSCSTLAKRHRISRTAHDLLLSDLFEITSLSPYSEKRIAAFDAAAFYQVQSQRKSTGKMEKDSAFIQHLSNQLWYF